MSPHGRPLSPFESIHALVSETTVMAIRVTEPLDRDALGRAWELLVQRNPVLTGRIEFGAAGLELAVDGAAPEPVSTGRVDPEHNTTTPIAFGAPVAGLDVTGEWASLITHHAIADGILMYHWFRTLWENYTQIVAGATIPAPEPAPVPAATETLLADRGVTKGTRTGAERLDGVPVHPFADPVGRITGADPFALHRLITVFGPDETAALRASAKAHQETLHGLICGAVLSAERELLEPDGALPLGLISHVNIRKWLTPPARDADGTNVLGYSCAQVSVGRGDDARAIGEQILAQLHTDLDDGVVQQTCLHIPEIIARWASSDNLEPISVSNMGDFGSLPVPASDFRVRGNANYAVLAAGGPPENLPLSTGRHHAVFSYGGRLNIQTTYPAAVLTADRAQAFADRIRALLLAMLDG
ncbi:hypothetical protein C1S82_09855 [Mycolicibacterium cosmeticum]|uniref:Phthiocerol/phthiodiolone dimycocerosyl transferase n=1 Tax=Mycolicibacterium cosmeticum TaxID=258533 RepID=W9BLC9_MYCCO|nr:hypothetical protein [Mycolicibacterium cosmeticum]TLH74855.1 hypothetical protein C1S82_09855 [Mycolicibacterium cosmeticum]CDO09430.1 polyketide synthase [Mycolicibacterium cosmeticum]